MAAAEDAGAYVKTPHPTNRYGGTQGSDGGRLEDSPEERALRWLVDEANAK